MMTHLAIVVVFWVLSVAASVTALTLALQGVPRRFLCLVLAIFALAVGYLGFGRWSPFRFFPQIGWMYTSGDFQIHIASSWFFLAPLAAGLAALAVLALGMRRTAS